jgi:PKD repeat protein
MKKLLRILVILLIFNSASAQNYITGLEYWFDTTYSAKIYQSVIPQHQFNYSSSINTTGLAKGLHTFHIRFKQTNGFWSQTVSGYFFKTGEDTSSIPKINAYRYWVAGKDSMVTVLVPNPVSPFNLVATLDLSWIQKGPNYLHMQFRDSQGNWSVATIDSFYKSALPVALFTTADSLFCTRDSVQFINNSVDGDEFMWHFGDGDSSTAFEPAHRYSVPGDYTVALTVTDTTTGEDSTLTLQNLVHVMQGATASFTFTQSFTQVTFTNTSQFANAYYWDFGDSTHSFLTNPVHTYLHDGNYTVVLSVTDSCGNVTDTQVVSLILDDNNIVKENVWEVVQNTTTASIVFLSNVQHCYFTLFDLSGKILQVGNIDNATVGFRKELSLESLPAGVYYLQIRDSNILSTQAIHKF